MNKSNIPHNKRYYGFDLIRGIATLLVIIFHYTYQIHVLYPHAEKTFFSFSHGEFPVYIFFALSGFFIVESLQRYSIKDFIKIRIIRIYPIFIIGCFLTTFILLISPLMKNNVDIVTFLTNLTLFPSIFKSPYIDGAYWTLPYEIGFYGFIVLYALIFKNKAVTKIFLNISKIFQVLKIYHTSKNSIAKSTPTDYFNTPYKVLHFIPSLLIINAVIFIFFSKYIPSPLHYFLMMTPYTHLFSLGIVLYFICIKNDYINFIHVTNLIIILYIQYYYYNFIGLIEVICIIFLFFTATHTQIENNILLKPFIILSHISYALYIIHQMIGITLIAHLEDNGINANIATIISMIIMIVSAYYITYYYDIPISKRLKKYFLKI